MHKSAGSTFSKNVGSWVKLQASSVSPGLLHNEHTSTFWCLRCKESAQKHPVYPVPITSRWLCVYSAGQWKKNRKHFHIMVTGKTRQIVPGLLSAAVLFLNNEPLSALMRWGQTQLFLHVTSLPTFHKSLCHPRTPLLWNCESNHMCENDSNASSSLNRWVQNSALKIKRGWNFHTRSLMGGWCLQEAIKAVCVCCLRWSWSQIFGWFPPGRRFLEYPVHLLFWRRRRSQSFWQVSKY